MNNAAQLKQQVPHTDPAFPFNIFHILPPEKQVLHLHWHEEWELIYLVKGNIEVHIDSQRICPQPGDMLFVESGRIHTGFVRDEHPVEYYALVFHPRLLASSLADDYHLQISQPLTTGRRRIHTHLSHTHPHYGQLLTIVRWLIDEHHYQRTGYQLALRSLLNMLLVELTRSHLNDQIAATHHPADDALHERFKKLITYIEQHYAEKLTVQQGAHLVNMSESHFCRTFKKITGKTFIAYVNLHRINTAEQLLLYTTDPVTEIAFNVGFSSINHFSQTFRDYKRCSPSECRKKQLEAAADMAPL